MTRVGLVVDGVVQGVGFRPQVFRAADSLGLTGFVRNRRSGVEIEVQGGADAIETFVERVRHGIEPPAVVTSVERRELPDAPANAFEILPSDPGDRVAPVVPADLATCSDCLTDVLTDGSRRYGYPFTTCTRCGPRYSVVEALPYDRGRTSMKGFALCDACRGEYAAPPDRRFHAETTACPRCGPRLSLLDRAGRPLAEGPDALGRAARTVTRGEVLALKGLGGFQLLVDAERSAAVTRLREHKHRPSKPFAVMVASLDVARRHAALTEAEAEALASAQAPIVLTRWRTTSSIAREVAPAGGRLGLMLPTTPLHHLLVGALERPVVCTSGNLAEEPICVDTAEALERLGRVADAFLVHDRPIVRPIDDSVARVGPRGVELVRRARGFAPLPIGSVKDARTVLALGSHLKSTVTLVHGNRIVTSQHLGDLETATAVRLLERTVNDLLGFFEARVDVIACDRHPDYASTRLAEALAARWDRPLERVQHHEAHVAAVLAEHAVEGDVLGLAWDGAGYGTDGTAWGGEAFVGSAAQLRRVAHVRPFPLPGGDRAAREPRRAGLGLAFEAAGAEGAEAVAAAFEPSEFARLLGVLQGGRSLPRTTSIGRLFDAVASLAGLRQRATFEAEAAIELELAAETVGLDTVPPYPFPLRPTPEGGVADWSPLLEAVMRDRRRGAPLGVLAARFHASLVELGLAMAASSRLEHVVLSGGCFQNTVLLRALEARLTAAGFAVLAPASLPPGDGAISAGQAWVVTHRPP